jgi:hypothetical protein
MTTKAERREQKKEKKRRHKRDGDMGPILNAIRKRQEELKRHEARSHN